MELPGPQMLDERVCAGYIRRAALDTNGACEQWLEAWRWTLRIIEASGIGSVREFDQRVPATHSLFNWVKDLVDELGNAGGSQFLTQRIAVAGRAIELCGPDEMQTCANMRMAIAESWFRRDDRERAGRLFREWLTADPKWGWGWIAWSDCYRFYGFGEEDRKRAGLILAEGFAVDHVGEREHIVQRMQDIKEERAAAKVRRQARVGRNEPCPCGSGRKFKKCCGG